MKFTPDLITFNNNYRVISNRPIIELEGEYVLGTGERVRATIQLDLGNSYQLMDLIKEISDKFAYKLKNEEVE